MTAKQRVDRKYYHTKKGIIATIYGNQIKSSAKRSHNNPAYTRLDLTEWAEADWLFDLLYTNWINCGKPRSLKPSVDRINDTVGYLFTNIQFVTTGENIQKAATQRQLGISETNFQNVSVQQFDLHGNLINTFQSLSEAARQVNGAAGNISKACKDHKRIVKGFRWKKN